MLLRPLLLAALTAPAPVAAPIDVPFDAPDGPQLVRVHVEVDGKSYEAGFEEAQRAYFKALFAWLDRNKDGFLDPDEARRAPLPLFHDPELRTPDVYIAFNFPALDANGDGRVSFDELVNYYRMFEGGPFLLFGEDPPAIGNFDLFAILDTNRDGKLSKEEIAAAAKVLAKFDRDGDDILTPPEVHPELFVPPDTPVLRASTRQPQSTLTMQEQLKRVAARKPDLELIYRLGEVPKGKKRLEVKHNAGKTIAVSEEAGEVIVLLGGGRLEFRCDRSGLTPHLVDSLKQQYRREVRPLDERYLDQVLELHARAMAKRLSLRVSRTGEGLWDLLDRNRDGVLGIREVRDAPRVLASLDVKGAGFITRNDVVPATIMQLGLGRTSFKRVSGSEVVTLNTVGRLDYPGDEVGGGPLWFRKMDRNGDGDVSRGEFLGTEEEFRKLDLDGDGLISREEAEAAERKRR